MQAIEKLQQFLDEAHEIHHLHLSIKLPGAITRVLQADRARHEEQLRYDDAGSRGETVNSMLVLSIPIEAEVFAKARDCA
jgi:hypothetical protein